MAIGVAQIGAGLIGLRRARTAREHPDTRLLVVVEPDAQRRALAARDHPGVRVLTDWRKALALPEVALVSIATPNGFIAEIGCAALAAGKHVLVEKPPGRNLSEAGQLADAAARSGRVLKIGFNHRYHPGLLHLQAVVHGGSIGKLINVRARYGHGGRPGYEAEWRGNPLMAGGGELTDQGVHLLDLANWILGPPQSLYCAVQTAVWPVQPLEDNAFAVLRYASGAIFSFHSSWTQWRNLFSLEVFGTDGAVLVEGLGGSYGTETLTRWERRPEGGPPGVEVETFEGPDASWDKEWQDLVSAISGQPLRWGTPQDGVVVMACLEALYRSAASGRSEALPETV